jgi:MFS family permease
MTSTSSDTPHPDNRFTLGIGTLLLCAFGLTMSNSMVFAVLSELQDEYGFSAAGLGYISAAGFLASIAMQLIVAPYADRGNPKRLVLAGLVIAVAGSSLFAVGGSLLILVLARGLTGVSLGIAAPAIRAIASNVDKSRSAERLGRLRGVELAGFTSGPLFGALLVGPLGIRGAFLVFAGIAALSVFLVAPRDIPELPSSTSSSRLSLELLRFRGVRVAAIASLTMFLPVGIYDALWDRFITDQGGNNFQVGLSFLLYTLPFVVFGARGGRLSDIHGPQKMVVIGLMLTIPSTAVYGLFTNSWVIVGFAVIEGSIGAIALPAAQSLMARTAPEGRASAAQGVLGAGDLMTATVFALIAPAIYGASGARGTFFSAAGIMTLLFFVVLWQLRGVKVPDHPKTPLAPQQQQ